MSAALPGQEERLLLQDHAFSGACLHSLSTRVGLLGHVDSCEHAHVQTPCISETEKIASLLFLLFTHIRNLLGLLCFERVSLHIHLDSFQS